MGKKRSVEPVGAAPPAVGSATIRTRSLGLTHCTIMSCATDVTPLVRRTRSAKSAVPAVTVASPARAESFFTFAAGAFDRGGDVGGPRWGEGDDVGGRLAGGELGLGRRDAGRLRLVVTGREREGRGQADREQALHGGRS